MKNEKKQKFKRIIITVMIFTILSAYLPSIYNIVEAVNNTTENLIQSMTIDESNNISDNSTNNTKNLSVSALSSVSEAENVDEDQEIEIVDENLKQHFLLNYDYNGNGKITISEMEQIEYFTYYSYDSRITIDLNIIKYCTNIKEISIYGEHYINVNVINELKNLERVHISGFKDVSFIEGLEKLKFIEISGADLSNINWDNVCKELETLNLNSNNLVDINFITKFENLKHIDLKNNKIKDLTPLKKFKNLETLYIDFTEENADLIEQLEAKNIICHQYIDLYDIKVEKGKVTEIDLPIIAQKVNDSNSKLYSENVSYNINNSSNVKINEDNSKIIIDATNLDVSTDNYQSIYLNSDHVTANINIRYTVYQPLDTKTEIQISDKAFKKLLLDKCDFDSDGIITDFDMIQITNLTVSYNETIKDISSLEYAQNIKSLYIHNYSGDISVLSKLNKLEILALYTGEKINDLQCIKSLKNLKSLSISTYSSTHVIDYASINELTQLNSLYISETYDTQGIDINKIANLTNLTSLTIYGEVFNAETISTFTNLTNLAIHTQNTLEDIEFVSKLINLVNLNLDDNIINDITPIKGLEKLQSVHLMKNPINTKELNNAETLQTLKERNVFVNIIETNSTENINFKDKEFKNALIKDGKDLNKDNEISIDEMGQMYSFNIGSNNNKIDSIEEIEYATNLYNLNICGKVEDLTPILKLQKLNTLTISGNAIIQNFELISQLKNLTELNVNNYRSNSEISKIDLQGIEKLTKLTALSLNGEINLKTCEELSSLKELTRLNIGLSVNYNDKNILDLQGIENLSKLTTITLSGEIKNIEALKALKNLKDISIYSTVYNSNDEKISLDNVMTLINELNLEKVRFNNYNNNSINLGMVLKDTVKEIKFEDINAPIKHLYDEKDVFYDSDASISTYSEDIKIDTDEKKITLNTDTLGECYAYINVTSEKFNGSFNLTWYNYIEGDTQKEINIPDVNLKNKLLEYNDIDKDGRITEKDMINIVSLYLGSQKNNDKITNLEGLQYAINLKEFDASDNYISDVTPIINLENVEFVSLYGNLITNVEFLNNVKWLDKMYGVVIINNFIDFSNNNENYVAYKNYYNNHIDMEPEYLEMELECGINSQRYGNISDIDKVVNFEENLKNRLIEIGVDSNHDNEITRRELYYIDSYCIEQTKTLSNANITDITGLEYLNTTFIDLSNNNINDITPLTKNRNLYNIDLSNNNISDLTGIENIYNLSHIKLSHNNIENIEPITNMAKLKDNNYRNVSIDLSNNKISNISCVKEWKNLYMLNLSNNEITDISSLKDYNFKVDEENEYPEKLTIDLSGNDINLTNEGNKLAKETFDNKGANLKLVDNSKTKQYILNENGVYTEESNLGTISTEISAESDFEYVQEKDRKYYPEQSDNNLAGIFINSIYYDSEQHNTEIKAKGYDKEVVVTGAIKTKNSIGSNHYLTAELNIPEGYIGNNAQIGTLNNAEIVNQTRNTITLKILLNNDSIDPNYLSFNCSVLLKAKEQVIENITDKEEIINAIEDEQNVTLDMKEETAEISNEVFKTLSEKEKVEFKVETKNAVWTFDSDTIENTEIKLNPKVQISNSRFEDMTQGGVEDGIFIKFEHEGVLPGKAEIELDVTDCNKYEEGKTIYLYYFDSEKNTYRYISTTRSENNKVKITLEHCSEYLLTEELLYIVGDVNSDGNITLADYTKILAHVKKTQELTGIALVAADVNGDGKVTLADYTKVLAHVKKTSLLD